MRKLIILSAVTLIWSIHNNLFSQKGFNTGITFRVIGDRALGSSLPVANFNGPTNSRGEFRNGFMYGLVFRYGINDFIDIESGINKGYRFLYLEHSNPIGSSGQAKINSFVELPLKFSYKYPIVKDLNMQLVGSVGGSLLFTLGEEFTGGGSIGVVNGPSYKIPSASIYMHDIVKSMVFALGVEKPHRKAGKVYYGVSYHHNYNKAMMFSTHLENVKSPDPVEFGYSYLSIDFKYFLPWRTQIWKKDN